MRTMTGLENVPALSGSVCPDRSQIKRMSHNKIPDNGSSVGRSSEERDPVVKSHNVAHMNSVRCAVVKPPRTVRGARTLQNSALIIFRKIQIVIGAEGPRSLSA